MDSLPHAVDEDLGPLGHLGRELLEVLHSPLLEELDDRRRRRADRDVGHEGEVFDESARLSFGRLGRADHAPVRVVELTRLGDLAIATDGSVAASEMGEGRGKGVTVEDLRDSGFRLHRLLLVAPVAGRERVLESVGDRVGLDGRVEVEGLLGLDALRVQNERLAPSSFADPAEAEHTFWRCR